MRIRAWHEEIVVSYKGMTFDPKNKAHKKQLYPVLKTLAALDPNKTPLLLIDDALGRPLVRSIDYINNVAKGDFDSGLALLIYKWLEANHFTTAHQISPEIFPETPERRWRKIVDAKAIEGKLRIVAVKRSMGIVQRSKDVNTAETTLKLGQEFYFELEFESEIDGQAILLQGLRNEWHPVPLADGNDYYLSVSNGLNVFPQSRGGQPECLVENHDLGLHEFLLVIADSKERSLEISKLISVADSFDIYRLRATFIQ